MQTTHLYEFGPFRLDVTEKLFLKNEEPVPLPPRAFEVLAVLVQRNGHLVEKDELLKAVWPDSFVEESNLAQNIYLLRKALGEGPHEHNYIETVPRRGYRFVADVKEVQGAGTDVILQQRTRARIVIEEENGDASPEELARSIPAIVPATKGGRHLRRNIFIALSALAGIGMLLYLWTLKVAKQADQAIKPRVVAVLPFKQLGAENSDELLGLGMADAIIIKLSSLQKLSVLPTGSVFRYAGRERDTQAVGRELGVDAVLDGTVQHADARVRVTVQMINVNDGKTLWSGKFDEWYTNIFALQDAISEEVTQALAIHLTRDERKLMAKRYTWNADAYQAYLMGLYFWNKRSKEGLSKAVDYFQQAIEKDPNYALAYAGLADSYYLSAYYRYGTWTRDEALGRAKAAAAKSIELDNTLAEAHTEMAMVHGECENNMAEALRSLQQAIALNPNYATAHLRYGWDLISYGRLDDALPEMKRAQELDPLSPTNNIALGTALYFARRYDEAIKYLQRGLELDPGNLMALYNLGNTYEQKGAYTEAISVYQKGKETDSTGGALENLGHVYAMMGRREEAQSVLRELEKSAGSRKGSPTNIALIYAALGQKDQAFEWLDRAVAEHDLMVMTIRYEPQMDVLRSDPRFVDFLRRHNYYDLIVNTTAR